MTEMKPTLFAAALLCFLAPWVQLAAQSPVPQTGGKNAGGVAGDSLMLDFSSDELIRLRRQYERETETLLTRKARLRENGIRRMERFVASYPDSPVLDKILVRLAGLYYEESRKEYAEALTAYQEQLTRADQDSTRPAPEIVEPVIDYGRSLELYQRVVDHFPAGNYAAEALYNKAFLLEDRGDRREATESYRLLAANYPDSRYTADALMRVAEYYFAPPLRDIETAISYYNKVLEYKDSPLYDAALYRLGWATYKLSDYPSAVAYFTLLADDIDQVSKLDPERKHHFPAVRDEAIEYIGISFLDFGGAERAAYYFDQIGGRGYGYKVFKKIGDAYLEVKEEYDEAIQAYEFLLSMYPDHPNAPYIQAKIAQAYRALDDEEMAFESRQQLFAKYGDKQSWGRGLQDKPKDKGRLLANRSALENLNYLLKRAQANGDSARYRKFVESSHSYLKAFPLDSSAARVHWNLALTLDTRLQKHRKALAEYIKISRLYEGSRFQEEAAANAIAVADELVKQTMPPAGKPLAPSAGTTAAVATPEQNGQARELSAPQKLLIEALDNYIRNFPDSEKTPKMLAQAGSIYYENGQYRESLRYFKTLASRFPKSPQLDYARFITMESYFGRGDLKSTELIARRLQSLGSEYGNKAKARLAESVFLQAKAAADSANHERAGDEYLRVVREVPDAKFADLALYNAALEYEKVQRYDKAIATYQHFLANYPESEHRLDGLNNLAFDYREIKDFRNAGLTYERLSTVSRSDSAAQAALYNASVSFVQGNEWQLAINTNNHYAERFPNADDADDLLFDNAAHYLRLGDLTSADEIYQRFAREFPNSPKVVDSHYHRGMYYSEQNQPEIARQQFSLAVEKAEALKKQGVAVDKFVAAEALFRLTGLDYNRFAAIDLSGGNAQNTRKKKQLLTEIVNNYTKVVGFGTARLPEATFRIGQAYEDFAASWARRPIVQTDLNKRIVERSNLNKTAAGLYEKAVQAYKTGAGALSQLLKKEQETVQSQAPNGVEEKLAPIDSTRRLTQMWAQKCREKVSENLFAEAQLYGASLQELLDAPSPAGISKLEELVYRQQVLVKAVAPLVKQVVGLHARNLEESSALSENNDWVSRSRAALVATKNLLPSETDRLSQAALSAYLELLPDFEQRVEKDDESAMGISDQFQPLLEMSATLAAASVNGFRKNVEEAAESTAAADSLFAAETETRMMQSVYAYAQLTQSLAQAADGRRQHYKALFDGTQRPGYEDAYYTFDDVYFALHDGARKLLDLGFAASQLVHDSDEWRKKLGLALVRLDPKAYSEKLGLSIETRFIPSSSTWLVTDRMRENWMQAGIPEADWQGAFAEVPASHVRGDGVRAIWYTGIGASPDSAQAPAGSAATAQPRPGAGAPTQPETAYFRRAFDIEGLPVSVTAKVYFPGEIALFINGHAVDAGEATPKSGVHEYSLTHLVGMGSNLLAIRAESQATPASGLESNIEIQFISDWSTLLGSRTDGTGKSTPGSKEQVQSSE